MFGKIDELLSAQPCGHGRSRTSIPDDVRTWFSGPDRVRCRERLPSTTVPPPHDSATCSILSGDRRARRTACPVDQVRLSNQGLALRLPRRCCPDAETASTLPSMGIAQRSPFFPPHGRGRPRVLYRPLQPALLHGYVVARSHAP